MYDTHVSFILIKLIVYYRNFAVPNISWDPVMISLKKIWQNYLHVFMQEDPRSTSRTHHHTHILPCITICQFQRQVLNVK